MKETAKTPTHKATDPTGMKVAKTFSTDIPYKKVYTKWTPCQPGKSSGRKATNNTNGHTEVTIFIAPTTAL